MASITDVEDHKYTFPIMLTYIVLVTTCGLYFYCKTCCKNKLASSINPRITLSTA